MLELSTNRLLVRDFAEGDWQLVYRLSREQLVTRYQSWMRVADEAAAGQWERGAMYHNGLMPRRAYNMALVERSSNQAIGWLGFGLRDGHEHNNFSFGYALLPAYWGKGYMTEAVQAALGFMFGSLDAEHVQAYCAASNPASQRVLEKSGLRFVSREPDHDEELCITEDYLYYASTLAEWQTANKTK